MSYFEPYYDSPAYGEWCRRVYGKDLKQLGCVTMDELEILYREIHLSPNSHILDMGCGTGHISVEIAKHYNSRLTAIDFDDGSINHAKKTFANNPAFNFIHGDGCEVFFETFIFDLITFCDSLHFTRTDEKLYALLDRCWTMLKPGGKLALFRWEDKNQVAIWAQNNNLSLNMIDLIETYKKLSRNVFIELITMSTELRVEIPETYERLIEESIQKLKNGDWGHRWLYILNKL
jgi:ubiquinone/menaquinone biosynthesis C-methylase UbiE